TANRPPGGNFGSPLPRRLDTFTRDSLAELMTKKFFVPQHICAEFALQKRAQFLRIALFSLSRSLVRQGSFELDPLLVAELAVEPCRPFFLKCFHKHPSVNSAISCAHKTNATSLCRSSIRGSLRSRDTASARSPSSKLRRGARVTVAQPLFRFVRGFRSAPSSRTARRPLSAPSWTRDRFPLVRPRRQTPRLRLSPVFSATNQLSRSSRSGKSTCKTRSVLGSV